jgi:histidinol-phosphate aminotransferase
MSISASLADTSPAVQPRRGVTAIPAYVAGEAEAGGAVDTVKLSSNESALGASPKAIAAYAHAAARCRVITIPTVSRSAPRWRKNTGST